MCIWEMHLTLYVRFSNIILNNNMTNIVDICVRITGYLLQKISIYWCIKIANIICQLIMISRIFQ